MKISSGVNRASPQALTAATPPLSMKSKIPIPAIDLATKCVVYNRGGLTEVSGGSLATANKCAAVLMVTNTWEATKFCLSQKSSHPAASKAKNQWEVLGFIQGQITNQCTNFQGRKLGHTRWLRELRHRLPDLPAPRLRLLSRYHC